MLGGRREVWTAVTLGLATALGVADLISGEDIVLVALLALPPLIAAAGATPLVTLVVGAYVVAIAIFTGLVLEMLDEGQYLVRVAAIALVSALAVWIATLSARVRASRHQLRVILENVADGITAQDPQGRVIFANRAALRAMGLREESDLDERSLASVFARFELLDEHGRSLEPGRLPGRQAIRGDDPQPTVIRYRDRESGEEHWSVVKATPVRDEDGRVTMAINVIEDVTERQRTERAQRFLSEASRLLAGSLDYETTLRRVAEIAVPDVADWCAVDVRGPDGDLQRVALAAADPAKLPLAEEVAREYPPDPQAPTGTPAVMRTGRSELYPEVTEEQLRAAARDERHYELVRGLGLASAIIAAMNVRDRTIGTITFVTDESGRHFDERDLEVADELARRAATAIDNARLFSEVRDNARALQESLLPPRLPEIEGVDAAARFRPAGEGLEVGGDFYDLFATDDSGWAVVMGDVCGKGADAAAITALARYTLRTASMDEQRPSAILRTLNEAMLRQRTDEQFCTVAFARLDVDGGTSSLTLSSGGHPLPLVLRADGSVETAGSTGTLLGVIGEPQLRDDSVELGPGDAVVLYTDGVTDALAPDRILTLADLADLLEGCEDLDAAALAERVELHATGGRDVEPRDDVAILVLKLRRESGGAA